MPVTQSMPALEYREVGRPLRERRQLCGQPRPQFCGLGDRTDGPVTRQQRISTVPGGQQAGLHPRPHLFHLLPSFFPRSSLVRPSIDDRPQPPLGPPAGQLVNPGLRTGAGRRFHPPNRSVTEQVTIGRCGFGGWVWLAQFVRPPGRRVLPAGPPHPRVVPPWPCLYPSSLHRQHPPQAPTPDELGRRSVRRQPHGDRFVADPHGTPPGNSFEYTFERTSTMPHRGGVVKTAGRIRPPRGLPVARW